MPKVRTTGNILFAGDMMLLEVKPVDNGPKLYVWFENPTGYADGDYICLEFNGGYERDALWYRPFWHRLRMELDSLEANTPNGWKQSGGMNGKAWRLNLHNPVLRHPLSREQAYQAMLATIKAFNAFPHEVGIEVEVI